MKNAYEHKTKLIISYIRQYITFIVGIAVVWVGVTIWKKYTLVSIPIDNNQMIPNFSDKTTRIGTPIKTLKYGDVVYYNFPHLEVIKNRQKRPMIFFSRVVGLPGDRIEIKEGTVYRNGKAVDESRYNASQKVSTDNFAEIVVPANHVFVLIDNRRRHLENKFLCYRDSRTLGPIHQGIIRARLEE